MSIIRFKDYVPEVYVSESRDFQLLLRVLDLVQNSVKFDIDAIPQLLSTMDAPSAYLERIKSKVGFYTDKNFPEDMLRMALDAFPYIIKYKGSKEGILRCVNTFLKISNINETCKIDIYNEDSKDGYKLRIGLPTLSIDTSLLEEMLRYVLPTGYFVEIYFYQNRPIPSVNSVLTSKITTLTPVESVNSSVRDEEIKENVIENTTYNTVQLSTIFNPAKIETDEEEGGI